MVIGTNSYTKLFPHLSKTPKVYRATLWLGAHSKSLDLEYIKLDSMPKAFDIAHISEILQSLRGDITYTPPIFSAKHINGTRAYKMARENMAVELPQTTMTIYDIKLLAYNHPFLSFEVSVSEGAYVRSIGAMIAKKLGIKGALSALERVSEGNMSVSQNEGMKILSPLAHLPYKKLENLQDYKQDLYYGKKIALSQFKEGKYIVCYDEFFSIIALSKDGCVKYILNRMAIC